MYTVALILHNSHDRCTSIQFQCSKHYSIYPLVLTCCQEYPNIINVKPTFKHVVTSVFSRILSTLWASGNVTGNALTSAPHECLFLLHTKLTIHASNHNNLQSSAPKNPNITICKVTMIFFSKSFSKLILDVTTLQPLQAVICWNNSLFAIFLFVICNLEVISGELCMKIASNESTQQISRSDACRSQFTSFLVIKMRYHYSFHTSVYLNLEWLCTMWSMFTYL